MHQNPGFYPGESRTIQGADAEKKERNQIPGHEVWNSQGIAHERGISCSVQLMRP